MSNPLPLYATIVRASSNHVSISLIGRAVCAPSGVRVTVLCQHVSVSAAAVASAIVWAQGSRTAVATDTFSDVYLVFYEARGFYVEDYDPVPALVPCALRHRVAHALLACVCVCSFAQLVLYQRLRHRPPSSLLARVGAARHVHGVRLLPPHVEPDPSPSPPFHASLPCRAPREFLLAGIFPRVPQARCPVLTFSATRRPTLRTRPSSSPRTYGRSPASHARMASHSCSDARCVPLASMRSHLTEIQLWEPRPLSHSTAPPALHDSA
jgi:hypothetical protein